MQQGQQFTLPTLFEAHHGLSPEHILSQGVIGLNHKRFTHNEYQGMIDSGAFEGNPFINTDYAKSQLDSSRKQLQTALSTPHDTLVRSAMTDWTKVPTRLYHRYDGDDVHMKAAKVLALHNELTRSSQPSDRTLYRVMDRGRTVPQDFNSRGVMSATETMRAADAIRGVGKGLFNGYTGDPIKERVVKLQPGSVSGVRLEDYGVPKIYTAGVPQDEWLISGIGSEWTGG